MENSDKSSGLDELDSATLTRLLKIQMEYTEDIKTCSNCGLCQKEVNNNNVHICIANMGHYFVVSPNGSCMHHWYNPESDPVSNRTVSAKISLEEVSKESQYQIPQIDLSQKNI